MKMKIYEVVYRGGVAEVAARTPNIAKAMVWSEIGMLPIESVTEKGEADHGHSHLISDRKV